MHKLISVIVPVYNAEQKVGQCIESILNQTYKYLELILVDDGSSDNSGLICDQYAERDNRIRVFHKNNGGQADARNFGLKECSGDYIGFVDNDDVIEPTMYETLLSNMIKNDVKISCCAYNVVTLDKVENKYSDLQTGLYQTDFFIKNMLYQNKYASGVVWNKLFDNSLIEYLIFPKGYQFEDYLATARALFKAGRIYFDNEPKYNWIQSEKSQSKKTYYVGQETSINVAQNINKFFKDENASQELIKASYYFEFIVRFQIINSIYASRKRKYRSIIPSQFSHGIRALYKASHIDGKTINIICKGVYILIIGRFLKCQKD